jgi:nitrate reductase gamma subunit
MNDFVVFGVFPYVSIFVAVSVSLYRYFNDKFSYSSFSSQFLENKKLFFGAIPWHYGIIIILLTHLFVAILPSLSKGILSNLLRLYILEITGISLAIFAFIGILVLILRRITGSRVFAVTSSLDFILLSLLLLQVLTGIYIAIFKRWGSLWYIDTAVPWLWSLFKLKPDISYIKELPFLLKLHFANAFLLVFVFPFTMLVHIFTFPIRYVLRPYQVVVWNRKIG